MCYLILAIRSYINIDSSVFSTSKPITWSMIRGIPLLSMLKAVSLQIRLPDMRLQYLMIISQPLKNPNLSICMQMLLRELLRLKEEMH